MPKTPEKPKELWKTYQVTLHFIGKFGASIPRTPDEIKAMLANRMPGKMPENATPIEELAEQVGEEVGASEEHVPGWLTFKRDDNGLYYEGRCVRGHLKDSAFVLGPLVKEGGLPFDARRQLARAKGSLVSDEGMSAFKAKFVNRVYVVEEEMVVKAGGQRPLQPDGTEQRFIHVMTPRGQRNDIKYVDYVERPTLVFHLKVLNDKVITEQHLRLVLDYGSLHGMGAERSQGWGRYSYTLSEVEE